MSFLKNGESGVGVFRARAVRGVSARFASRTTALCTPNSVHDALGPKPTPETNKVMGTDPIGSPQFLGNVAAKSTGLGTTFFTSLLVPALGAAALALVAACVAGFLVAVREMVRACREATIASRSVTRCAVSIDAACLALERTLIKADFVLEDVGKMSSTTSSVLETSLREAGVLQRRLSDLPNTASRTLMEAITRQYASPIPLTDGNGNVTTSKNGTGNAVNAQSAGVWAGDTRIVIGDVIEGTKDGNRWIGGTIGCNFQFNRANRFRVGEYCAVPRNDDTYTWGVIELNDKDYSVDDSGDGWASNMTGDEENVSGSGALSCVWPPRDPDSIPDSCVDGSKDFDGTKGSRAGSARDAANNASWLERVVVKFLGDETADAVEGWVRSATGLTTVEEAEYKVVVELDADAYSFKIMNAGDLGKRPSA